LLTLSKHNLVRRCVPHTFVYLSGNVSILHSDIQQWFTLSLVNPWTFVWEDWDAWAVSTELSLNKASKQSLSAWCSFDTVAHFNPIQFFSYNLRLGRFHNRRNSILAKSSLAMFAGKKIRRASNSCVWLSRL
jgi:hypothetical protein